MLIAEWYSDISNPINSLTAFGHLTVCSNIKASQWQYIYRPLDISESHFEPWNFIGTKTGGRGKNISGFSQTSPKIQFRALHSMRGENSHISYMGDNFFRSQIVALLSSFHISSRLIHIHITCLRNFGRSDIKKR